MTGLLDRGDLDELLKRTKVTGYANQVGGAPSEHEPPVDPATQVGINFDHRLTGDLSAQVGAKVTSSPDGRVVSPNFGIGAGPVQLRATGAYPIGGGDPSWNYGGDVKMPIGNAALTVGGSITPDQVKQLAASLNIPIGEAAKLAFTLSHTMPNQGDRDTRAGFRFTGRF